jgi:PrtD family type I secretion system ABC transporter
MTGRMNARWAEANAKYMASQQRTSDVAGGLGAISKVFRMALQSAVLATGAYLVVNQQATGGIIIAGSILTARALAPVELAIANWKGFVTARQSWARLKELLTRIPRAEKPLALPRPHASFTVEGVSAVAPGQQKLIVQDVSFALRAGNAVGVIGPSASGKSSLVRLLVGVWAPARGTVRLDGAALEQWDPEALGEHIGYLPQDVELFAGTVAQNIARFDPKAEAEDIIAAARAAGVHELILRLPEGYETQIGDGGAALSAGQRQRVALARALYREPFLVVLDEPNSNLDAEGEHALSQAIQGVRARGGIVVVVAHRPSALASVDLVLMMAEGRIQAFGPKDEVLAKVLRPVRVPAPTPAAGSRSGGIGNGRDVSEGSHQ